MLQVCCQSAAHTASALGNTGQPCTRALLCVFFALLSNACALISSAMTTAGETCLEATLQEQVDRCIARLQALRCAGGAIDPQATGALIAQFSQLLPSAPSDSPASVAAPGCGLDVLSQQSHSSACEQPEAAAPLLPESAAAEDAAAPLMISYANVVKRGHSPPPRLTTNGIEMGKYGCGAGLREYPSGDIKHFQAGLLDRIGMPHLEYAQAMQMEHCSETGSDMFFTTRNYGIVTCARDEWNIVVNGAPPPSGHVLHGRILRDMHAMQQLYDIGKQKAGLRPEEVRAVVLYTGPMYVIYNAILTRYPDARFNGGHCSMWQTLSGETGLSKNLFSTTLSVLVSAVQKLSAVTVYKEGLKLYRGTGGEVNLPKHFSTRDSFGCKGLTDWGFCSATRKMEVARKYSGALESKPNPVVFEIETNCVDRGASVGEFSQYPKEEEFIFVP